MKKADNEKMIKYACAARLEIIENRECYVEGVREITEYNEDKIKIDLGKLSVSFFGDGLYINSFSPEGAVIEGTIITMEFLNND